MNQKTSRKYELIAQIAVGENNSMQLLTELCSIDFQTAFEMWEYALSKGKDLVDGGFDLFQRVSETKTRQLFCESLPLQKLVYSSPSAAGDRSVVFLANLVLGNKLDAADECLQKLRTNSFIDFSDTMRLVLDTTFALYCERNNVRVPVFNKKQKNLIIGYINKMKGPNKALLLQRMKEL